MPSTAGPHNSEALPLGAPPRRRRDTSAQRPARPAGPRRGARLVSLSLLVSTLSLGLTLGPRPVLAAPAAAPTTVDGALEAGDLSQAHDLAVAARKDDPTPQTWADEAKAATALGDYEGAIAAWSGYREALEEDAVSERETATATIKELREESRGVVEDEPASSHREAFDQARAARIAALAPKPGPKKDRPPPPKPKERIVKKWYFWLTVAAIAASAGAITGIAVQAAREEQMDDLSVRGGAAPTGPGGFVVRF